MKYRILTFSPIGHPSPVEEKSYYYREEAEQRMKELESIYDVLFISES